MEEKLRSKLAYKVFLIANKYIPHFIALMYILYTFLGFCEIDAVIIGRLVSLSVFAWAYFLSTSILFRYCYVHRLPLYYIALNEIITDIDYYINIPISDFNLLVVHILLIGIFIYLYSVFYVKNIKRFITRKDR